MAKHFDHKKKGDPVTANWANDMQRTIEGLLRPVASGYSSGQGSKSSSLSPFIQRVMFVNSVDPDDPDTVGVYARYYDHEDEEWKNDDGQLYHLDPTSVGITVEEGDYITAYWDPQRDMFIPIVGSSCATQFRIFIMGAPSGGTFTVPINIITEDSEGTRTDNWEDVVFNYDDNEADAKTAMETHSLINDGDVEVDGPGGGFPGHELIFTFPGEISAADVEFGNADDSSLTGGSFTPFTLVRKCCG